MIELELTYLAKYLPERILDCDCKEVIDIYFPKGSEHPVLRLRKSGPARNTSYSDAGGDKMEMTKKQPISVEDASEQTEDTILLSKEEYEALAQISGKKVHKIRYYFDHEGRTAEIDVFQGDLEGLVVVDFEFETKEEKATFEMPEFCLADVTQETFIAGGMICGKSYRELEESLGGFEYKKLYIENS